MTRTNGRDQLAEFHREQGRQHLGKGRRKSFLSSSQTEGMLVTGISEEHLAQPIETMARRLGAFVAYKPGLSKPRSPRNVSVDNKPAIERRDDPTIIPVTLRRKPKGLAEGYKSICERWSLDAPDIAKLLHLEEETGLCDLILSGQVPPMTGDLKDRMALVIGISIGLGDLFHDDKDAELQWLSSKRPELGDVSPLDHMLKGDLLNVGDVIDLVDNARGLR